MKKIDSKKIIGETFEDMSILEMTMVQGSGEIEDKSILTAISAGLGTFAATWSLSVGVVKTFQGKC